MFIGIDPDDVETIEFGNARVSVGVVEFGIWERIQHQVLIAVQDAKRYAIRKLAAEGLDPEEPQPEVPSDESGYQMTRADFLAFQDPNYRERLAESMTEAARYGVRGHEIRKKNGEPVPFETLEEMYEGAPIKVVSSNTLRWYKANPAILRLVWMKLKEMNSLGAHAKKV